MPISTIALRPGIQTEYTALLNSAGYTASQLIRFRAGLFEKLGGWVSAYGFSVGIPRVMQAWQDFNSTKRLAVGATTAVTVLTQSGSSFATAQNITPQTLVTDFAPNFTTTASSTTVTITDPNINTVTTLDSVEFETPVSVGGIILSGPYPIDLVVSATQYRITAATAATSSVANGGAVPVFGTTSGSSTVVVTFANHTAVVGDVVVLPVATTVGGLTIQGSYTVIAIVAGVSFSISASGTASSTTSASMNGGNAEIKYYIALGPVSVTGTGFGIDGYGDDPWGGTGSGGSVQTGTPITTTDYSLQNWGQTLLANPEGGGLYQWAPGSGYQNMQLVEKAPLANGMLVATPAQFLIMWGASIDQNIGRAIDPLTYAWSDQADYTYWSPSGTNPNTGAVSQAGSNRLSTGSRIVAGLQAPQQILLWTDLDLWAINYVGYPLVFGQTKIGANCGAVSKHGIAQMGGVVYWIGRSNFYALAGGAPTVIPCTVWDAVFQDIDTANLDKCWVQTVTSFNECWFFYPSASGGTGQCDSYAKVNVIDGSWDYGPLPRAAGIDQSVLGNPIMATPGGIIYTHESGYNADTQPLMYSVTTGYFMIGDGEDYISVDQILPDMKWGLFNGAQTASVQMTFSVINYDGDTPNVFGPYTMTSSTNQISLRFRGRQMQITISGSDLNSFARLGRLRYRWSADGRH